MQIRVVGVNPIKKPAQGGLEGFGRLLFERYPIISLSNA